MFEGLERKLRYLRIYLMAEKCICCKGTIGYGSFTICDKCRAKLISAAEKIRSVSDCPLIVAYEYSEEIRPLIHSLKYRRNTEAGMFLAAAMKEACSVHGYSEFDLVVGVPCYRGRSRKSKRFCQAEYIAAQIGLLCEWPFSDSILYKHRNVKSQTRCKSRSERRENVKDVYRVKPDSDIVAKKILLVDDVTTTGATMGECASALMKAGAASVVCVAAAKPVNPEKQEIPIRLGSGYYEFSDSIDNTNKE